MAPSHFHAKVAQFVCLRVWYNIRRMKELPTFRSTDGLRRCVCVVFAALSFCAVADASVRGAYPILTTPYLADGALDCASLVREAEWTDAAGVDGVIWPQSDDSCDLLTTDEKKRGMSALAEASKGFRARLCLGVQGRDTAEMLALARHGESLAATVNSRIVFISRPGDDCRTQEDLERYYEALAEVAKRPVIIQTYNGDNCPSPSVEFLVKLAERHPAVYGWIKEEVRDGFEANRRMKAELAAKPPLKTVFSAWGGWQWLYQARRLGSEGVISERAALAPMLAWCWAMTVLRSAASSQGSRGAGSAH